MYALPALRIPGSRDGPRASRMGRMSRWGVRLGLGLVALVGCTLDPITETEKLDRRDRELRCTPAQTYTFESRGWGAPVRPDVMICSPDSELTATIEVACQAGEVARLTDTPSGMTCGPNLATSLDRDRRECVVAQPAKLVEARASCSNWWGAAVYRASP